MNTWTEEARERFAMAVALVLTPMFFVTVVQLATRIFQGHWAWYWAWWPF